MEEKQLLADLYNKVTNIEQMLKQLLSFIPTNNVPEATAEEIANDNGLKFDMLYENEFDEEYDIESELKKFVESNNHIIDMDLFDDISSNESQEPKSDGSMEEINISSEEVKQ